MIDTVVILVFSVAMLAFMAFPAIKITEWLKEKFNLSQNVSTVLQITLTIVLSLCIGLFLKFA